MVTARKRMTVVRDAFYWPREVKEQRLARRRWIKAQQSAAREASLTAPIDLEDMD
jgi:hypothetical protein